MSYYHLFMFLGAMFLVVALSLIMEWKVEHPVCWAKPDQTGESPLQVQIKINTTGSISLSQARRPRKFTGVIPAQHTARRVVGE